MTSTAARMFGSLLLAAFALALPASARAATAAPKAGAAKGPLAESKPDSASPWKVDDPHVPSSVSNAMCR